METSSAMIKTFIMASSKLLHTIFSFYCPPVLPINRSVTNIRLSIALTSSSIIFNELDANNRISFRLILFLQGHSINFAWHQFFSAATSFCWISNFQFFNCNFLKNRVRYRLHNNSSTKAYSSAVVVLSSHYYA